MKTPITVVQNTDPKFSISLNVAGTETPYDLTGSTVSFYIKAAPGAADGSPKYTVGSGITVTDAAGGDLDVQFNSSDIATAGSYWYKLVVTKSGLDDAVMYGPLAVVAA